MSLMRTSTNGSQTHSPSFVELAPDPTPSEEIKVTLRDYLEPESFISDLDVVDEELRQRRVEMKSSPYKPVGAWLDENALDDLETWTALYDPAGVVLSFENPEDALFKSPRKVIIDQGQTACFFKPCYSEAQTRTELDAYKKIAAAALDSQLRVCRLHDVVLDGKGFIVGLLLTYIDNGDRPLSARVDPTPPSASIRTQWVSQIKETLAELHEAGVIWGDVKAENVLVDMDDNAWLIDFGGGYTEGWVDKDVAGPKEGTLQGMAKIEEFIFQSE